MKKRFSQLIVKIVDKSIRKEADSVCLGMGYQPLMPESVKKISRKKK